MFLAWTIPYGQAPWWMFICCVKDNYFCGKEVSRLSEETPVFFGTGVCSHLSYKWWCHRLCPSDHNISSFVTCSHSARNIIDITIQCVYMTEKILSRHNTLTMIAVLRCLLVFSLLPWKTASCCPLSWLFDKEFNLGNITAVLELRWFHLLIYLTSYFPYQLAPAPPSSRFPEGGWPQESEGC